MSAHHPSRVIHHHDHNHNQDRLQCLALSGDAPQHQHPPAEVKSAAHQAMSGGTATANKRRCVQAEAGLWLAAKLRPVCDSFPCNSSW